MTSGLTDREVIRVVNRYIGVSGGYLGMPGPFTYRTHADFYSEYCDLDVSLVGQEGTTRQIFIGVLSSMPPFDQAKVLRGVIERFPPDEDGAPATRKAAHVELLTLIRRLESGPLVAGVSPQITSEVVRRALLDAENLIRTSGPTSAVDRVHTALHGYLVALCQGAGVSYQETDSMVAIFKKVRVCHPAVADLGPRARDIERVLNACSAILDAMLPVRNRASVAHPNAELLGEVEARLVINVGRTLLSYLDAKLF